MAFEIRQYQTVKGKVPFRQWLLAIREVQVRARIRARIDRLQLGNFGDCKNLSGGLFELRLMFGPGYRIYFGKQANKIVVLLCAGDKSRQSKDIEMARAYWTDYLRRTQ